METDNLSNLIEGLYKFATYSADIIGQVQFNQLEKELVNLALSIPDVSAGLDAFAQNLYNVFTVTNSFANSYATLMEKLGESAISVFDTIYASMDCEPIVDKAAEVLDGIQQCDFAESDRALYDDARALTVQPVATQPSTRMNTIFLVISIIITLISLYQSSLTDKQLVEISGQLNYMVQIEEQQLEAMNRFLEEESGLEE